MLLRLRLSTAVQSRTAAHPLSADLQLEGETIRERSIKSKVQSTQMDFHVAHVVFRIPLLFPSMYKIHSRILLIMVFNHFYAKKGIPNKG